MFSSYSNSSKFFSFIFISLLVLSFTNLCWGESAKKSNIKNLVELSLEELLQISVVKTASGLEETLADAPATMVIITAEDIQNRGYTDLVEILADLPGFDTIVFNTAAYVTAYQRGYRTPSMSRTLLMIDGVVDNDIAEQESSISRQYPLSNIDHIEVLYGPASAVYGPNAFLGIINIITHNAAKLDTGKYQAEANVLVGSYNSKGLEVLLQGKPTEDLSFSITYKKFKSDEPNFTGKFGFLDQHWLNDEKIWGPLLHIEHEGRMLGEYYDPTDDYSVIGNIRYKDFKLGLIHWLTKEGYGPYYAADHGQPNSFWNKAKNHVYLEHRKLRIKLRAVLYYAIRKAIVMACGRKRNLIGNRVKKNTPMLVLQTGI